MRDVWSDLKPKLAGRLADPESIERELLACGAAVHFEQIGVDRQRALAAVRFAHFVRARYTILHLLADVGLLAEWSEAAIQ